MDEKILSARRSSADMDKQGGRLWNGELDYRALFEQTGDCVFIVNLDLNLVTLNPQAARLLGYSNGEYSAALAGDLFNLSDPFPSADNSGEPLERF
ncbi:MAG: PAS domain-containing protein [Anaerolineales bacterium]|nr:PAS domain-containing protein [Anaerolineales bacterium]